MSSYSSLVCDEQTLIHVTAGLSIYRAALVDPTVSSITLLMRREMPSWADLPQNTTAKSTTIVHTDFTSYVPELATRLAQHDACIWAIGKSSRGVNEKDYTVYTYTAPMALAGALRDAGVGDGRPADKPFRFVYVSGESADPSQTSSQMWARVKVRICRVERSKRLMAFAGTSGSRPRCTLRSRTWDEGTHHPSGLLPPREGTPARLAESTKLLGVLRGSCVFARLQLLHPWARGAAQRALQCGPRSRQGPLARRRTFPKPDDQGLREGGVEGQRQGEIPVSWPGSLVYM